MPVPATAPAPVTGWPPAVVDAYRRTGLWDGRTLIERVAAAAEHGPDDEALVDGDRTWTYTALMADVRALAAGLRGRLAVGDRVVVQLPNRAEAVLSTLACLSAGLVPVWALPQHREHELGAFATRCSARAVITSAEHRGTDGEALAHRVRARVPGLELVVVVGRHRDAASLAFDDLVRTGRAHPVPEPTRASEAVAVLIPSGGTTGASKIVPRTHDDLGYMLRAACAAAGFDRTTRYLVVLPVGHGFANTGPGVLGTLVQGGTVVLSPSPAPATALGLAAAHRVTATSVVPAVLRRWVEHLRTQPVDLTALTLVQSGAAYLPPELAQEAEQLIGCVVQQVYGMSEGLTCMTRPDDPPAVRHGTQGRPLSTHDELRVVDDDGVEVPDGTVGTLTVRGPYTVRSYYRSPEVDATAFTADGWYVTGDLVARRSDGRVVVHGRVGDTVNRGGESVSATEVEDLLRTSPAVRDCAVVPVPDPVYGEEVGAFVVARPSHAVDVHDVADHLGSLGLAEYKVPRHVFVVDALPLTGIGKVDRRTLRARAAAATSGSSPVADPGDDPCPAPRPDLASTTTDRSARHPAARPADATSGRTPCPDRD